MNDVVRDYPGLEIHDILDNLNTGKPKYDRWLRLHPAVHFRFNADVSVVASSGRMLVQHSEPPRPKGCQLDCS
jgi:hypothetical protein